MRRALALLLLGAALLAAGAVPRPSLPRPEAARKAVTRAAAALEAAAGRDSTSHASAGADSARTPTGHVLAVRLEGPVSPVMDDVLRAALQRAEREDAAALLIEIDTPGGLESSMRTMIQRLLASEIPVIAWVTPAGAHAASAGVFIVMACDVAAMSPGTNIGAATPISMSGPMDSTLARKATNDAAAFARTVASQRGRSVRWAERAVREAIAASETEAVADSVVDFIAGTEAEVLAKADGHPWRRGELVRPLRTKGLEIRRLDPDFRQRLLGHIADPNVAYILMMLGFYGLIFELQNPGAILPGIVGGICLVLAFFALSTLPVNAAGVALILLGVAFLLAEIKVASHGMLAIGGTLSLALGTLMLFRSGTVHVSLPVVLVGTAITAGFFLWIVGAGLRSRQLPVTTGSRGLVGRRGTVVERIDGSGRVRLGDELWNATAASALETGTEVEVVAMSGLQLSVRQVHREE
jgi:membrane-bound serine protease (ClpP class)